MPTIHKILRTFAQTRLTGENVEFNNNGRDIFCSSKESKIERFKEGVNFCVYKTIFKNNPSMLMVFCIDLPTSYSAGSQTSEIVFNLIHIIESTFFPISHFYFDREVSEDKSRGYLTIIKEITEDSIV